MFSLKIYSNDNGKIAFDFVWLKLNIIILFLKVCLKICRDFISINLECKLNIHLNI